MCHFAFASTALCCAARPRCHAMRCHASIGRRSHGSPSRPPAAVQGAADRDLAGRRIVSSVRCRARVGGGVYSHDLLAGSSGRARQDGDGRALCDRMNDVVRVPEER